MTSVEELKKKSAKDQAVHFLNAFWDEIKENADEIYNAWKLACVLGEKTGLLEGDKALEFLKLRHPDELNLEVMKKVDPDKTKKFYFIDYLLFKYAKDAPTFKRQSVHDANTELAKAEAAMESVGTALKEVTEASAELAVIEEQLSKAVEELHAEEAKVAGTMGKLSKEVSSEGLSSFRRGSANAKLSNLTNQDNSELQKAKITSESALKKAQKSRQENKRKENQLKMKHQEAKICLKRTKDSGGAPRGQLWWMWMEIYEAELAMPRKKEKAERPKWSMFDA